MLQSKRMSKINLRLILPYLAWVTALASMLGSLYFSEVLKFTPCILCWYQRIFMYPLVLIIPIGVLLKDKFLPYYVLSLAGIGAVIALYHTLLNWNIIPEAVAPCALGVSCTTRYIDWFGFVNIPFMSFVSFTVILICMIIVWKISQEKPVLETRRKNK